MEMIENIVWIMTGFISALVTMAVGWRMAKGHAKRQKMTSGSKPVAFPFDRIRKSNNKR